jgi:hypothetical protein
MLSAAAKLRGQLVDAPWQQVRLGQVGIDQREERRHIGRRARATGDARPARRRSHAVRTRRGGG